MILPLLLALAAQDPYTYLRTAVLTASTDTFDTFESEPRGSPRRGNGAYVIRVVRPMAQNRWELVDTWYDSTGRETARQYARTASRSLMTELETVRAKTDSASLLVTAGHVTAWVVPSNGTPQLFDDDATGERYHAIVVATAIVKSNAVDGRVFRFPAYSLYGGSPTATRPDSVRIVRRDTLYRGQARIPVLVLQRSNGTQVWADERTGAEVLSHGNAGPNRWWWHIRRGVSPP